MALGMGGTVYTYFEGKIEDVRKEIPEMSIAYDDSAILDRLNKIEAKDVSDQFAVVTEKLSQLQARQPYDPEALEHAVNEIKVLVGKIQVKLEGVDEKVATHTHDGS